MSTLQAHYHFKLDFEKGGQNKGGIKRQGPNTARTISFKAWNSRIKYPKRECKHDIRDLKVTCSVQYSRRMPNGENTQGVAHLHN